MIDSHAHIYLPEFNNDRQQVVERAEKAGVTMILMPAIDSTTHGAMLKVEEVFPVCYAMIGLHPCSVKENYEEELDTVRGYLTKRRFVAVGEIGLDFYWDKTFTSQQYKAFETQIEWAKELGIPIVIHSRNATDECIEVISSNSGVQGVFHCFSGNLEQAKRIIGLGFYLGVGGVLSFKNAGLDKVISEIGLDRVILETDAPYLSPVPYRGKRNEPSYTKLVAEKLAQVTNNTIEEVEKITVKNTNELFNLR